jgi:hypothetical protein
MIALTVNTVRVYRLKIFKYTLITVDVSHRYVGIFYIDKLWSDQFRCDLTNYKPYYDLS